MQRGSVDNSVAEKGTEVKKTDKSGSEETDELTTHDCLLSPTSF